MTNNLWLILFTLFFLPSLGQKVVEKPEGAEKLVNDFTSTLSSSQIQSLENKLVAFDDKTSNQIAVVIIPTTNGADISSYAFKLGEDWGVGNASFDNGVVLLIAKDDRDLFLATGYGVEEYIPDLYANQVVDLVIVPEFKNGNFYGGIEKGTDEIINLLEGTFEPRQTSQLELDPIVVIFLILLVIIIFFAIINSSGSGGTTVSRRGTTYYPNTKSWGGGSSWSSGSSGGGWSSGSGGGGSFGGFGGGSFGGGGAGGSW